MFERPIFNYQPLIVAEIGKHYYYLGISHDEIVQTEHVYRMEKSAIKKFVDVEKARWLKDLNSDIQLVIIDQLIYLLQFFTPHIAPGSVWLVGVATNQTLLPYCSILEVGYDEKQECFWPDLIFCHPKSWDFVISQLHEIQLREAENEIKPDLNRIKTNHYIRNEIERIRDKFGFYLENITKDPFNSVLVHLETDLTAILFYITYLKNRIVPTDKNSENPLKSRTFYIKDLQEKTLIFNRFEQPIFNHQPLIVAETEKHYYYLSFSHNERIATDHIFCMEKSAMKKFVDVKKSRWLEDLNSDEQSVVVEELIKHLSFIWPDKNMDPVWLIPGILDKDSLPHCSILEVHYNEKEECFLPDLVFCNPEIWNLWIESEYNKTWINYNIENEIARILEKFKTQLANGISDFLNSIWTHLRIDLELIIFYLKDLKERLKKMNKNLNN